MTFMTKLDGGKLDDGPKSAIGLSQHGRASLQILGAIQAFAAANLRPAARAAFEVDPEAISMIAEHAADSRGDGAAARIADARKIADRIPAFRIERFLQRWVGEENFNTGIPAVEQRRTQFEAWFQTPIAASAGGTLALDDAIELPGYYTGTEWHLEPGGWDGYDLYGALFAFGVGPYVFAKGGYAAVGVGDDIARQRIDVVRQFPKPHYNRIFEPGCGGATTALALHSVFPKAELVGCDLSPALLRNGHRVAERLGVPIHLKQANAVATGEPDASFDGVISYALHHELPPRANARLFDEMFRIMKPGADIVISDPPPFRAVDLFQAVILDWETAGRAEPFFSAVLHSRIDEQLSVAGFTEIESYPLGQGNYPWITRARKPVRA